MEKVKCPDPKEYSGIELKDGEEKTFDRAWEITKEINENIRHYNEHQTKYRTLASQWLIGAFAAMGFVLAAKLELSFDKLWLVAFISLVSAFGVYQLWRIDIPVFQAMIAAYFGMGICARGQVSFSSSRQNTS